MGEYDRTAQLISRTDPGGTTTFAYDAYGNQTSSARAFNSVTTYTYDLGDRLTAMTLPGAGNSTYIFSLDALGRPVSRAFNGGGTDTYAYVGTGTTAWRAVLAGTTIDAGIGPDESRLALKAGAAFSWLLPDLHGNLAAGINSAETTVTDAWRYDGYGRPAAGVTTGVSNPWGYQGRLAIGPDPANPFYAAGARYYDPNLGAFTQLDTVTGRAQDPLSMNRYLYAEANPATLIDPTGHMAADVNGGRVDYKERRAYYTARAQQSLRRSGSRSGVTAPFLPSVLSATMDTVHEALTQAAEGFDRGALNAVRRANQWAGSVRSLPFVGSSAAREVTGAAAKVASLNRGLAQTARSLRSVLGPISVVLAALDGAEIQQERDANRKDLSPGERTMRTVERAGTAVGFAGAGAAAGRLCPGLWRLACVPVFSFIGEQIGAGPGGDLVNSLDDSIKYDPGPLRNWIIDYETPQAYGNA